MRAANSAAQVSTAWYTGRTASPQRISRITVSVVPRSSAICASEKPFCFAVLSVSASRAGAAATCSAIWLMYWICSMNHGSMPVVLAISAALAPARSACWMVASRPSCGVPQSRSKLAASPGGFFQPNELWLLSSERFAFCMASAKFRPIAMASPTLFMWVVSVGSAPGNFSNANRGTLTTT